MSRPTPRKTSLGRLSPVDPAPQATTSTPAQTAPPPVTSTTPTAPVEPAPAPAEPVGERRKYRHKVSFYQDEEDTARVRAAILHTNHLEGPRSLSQFIHHAVMAEVRRLEERYNDGEPWPGVAARELPQGRPMGS